MTPQRNKRRERSSSESEKQQPLAKHDTDMPSSSSSSSAYYPFVNPPGLRFVPTDEELILNYLKPFSRHNKFQWPNLPIHRVNIYESNPQQLSAKYEMGNLKEWFFISERTKIKKYGKFQKRSDNGGYWLATGVNKINAGQGVVGYRAALSYYVGKQPNGVKANWLMKEYWLESSHDNKTMDHALCKIYLSPMAKNKQKEEGVRAEALEEELVQPPNVENQQPQFCTTLTPLPSDQPQPFDINDYQKPQFWPVEPDSHKSQRRDIGYNEPHQSQTLDNTDHHLQRWQATMDSNQTQPHDVAHHQPRPSHQPQPLDTIDHQHQLQFWQTTLDSNQTQPHDIAYHEPHQPQPLDTIDHQHQLQFWQTTLDSNQTQPHDIAYHQPHQPQPLDTIDHQHQLQFWQTPVDSNQTQPHDIAYHQPHQPQPLDTFQYQLSQSWSAPLDSHQSHFHDIQYHQSQPLAYQHLHQSQFCSAPPDQITRFNRFSRVHWIPINHSLIIILM